MRVYKLAGSAGFLWAATFNQDGRGVLRFLTTDASEIEPAATPAPSPSITTTAPGQGEKPKPSESTELARSRSWVSLLQPQVASPAQTPQPPTEQRAPGEFARLVMIPAACENALKLGHSELWHLFPQNLWAPGPACFAVVACFRSLRSKAAGGVKYLQNNPEVNDALLAQLQAASSHAQYVPDPV